MDLLTLLAEAADAGTTHWGAIAGVSVLFAGAAVVFVTRSKAKPEQEDLSDPQARLRRALGKSRSGLLSGVKSLFSKAVDADAVKALEQILIEADVGVTSTEKIIAKLQEAVKAGKVDSSNDLLEELKRQLKERLGGEAPKLRKASSGPTVILMVGTNGVGKTTSISKLAKKLAGDGHKVLLAASDTFRAAAVDQLVQWANTLDLEIVRGTDKQKPDAVAYDAAEKAKAKDFDYLIVDTAGRLHTKKNLMTELEKIARVLGKPIDGAPHETLLVIDANNGQNALQQTKAFSEATEVTGIFLTKLDGTAKGGIVLRIREELEVPVKYVGLGEQPDDIAEFDAETFVDALFE